MSADLDDFTKSGDYIADLSMDGIADLSFFMNTAGKFGGSILRADGKFGKGMILPDGSGFDLKGNFAPFSTFGEREEPESEFDDRIVADGPQYIGKVTDDAKGFVKANVKIKINDNGFYSNGKAWLTRGFCMEGPFRFDLDDNGLALDLGTRSNRIQAKATADCEGPGVEGFLNIRNTSAAIGMYSRIDWSQEIGVDVVSLKASFNAEMGGEFGMRFDPYPIPTDATLKLNARLALEGCADFWLFEGCQELAGVSFGGDFSGRIEPLSLSGRLYGSVEICEVDLGEVSFSMTIP